VGSQPELIVLIGNWDGPERLDDSAIRRHPDLDVARPRLVLLGGHVGILGTPR